MKIFSLIKKIFLQYRSRPAEITFFVTNRCNLACSHCFNAAQLQSTLPGHEVHEPSLETIKQIAQTMQGVLLITLSGGEPFLRDDLPDIVKTFRNLARVSRVSIPTNGYDTVRILSAVRRILEEVSDCTVFVKVSLDGFRDTHNAVRQCACYDNACDTLRQLLALKQTYANLMVGVLYTLTAVNQDMTVSFICSVFQKYDIDVFGINLVRGDVPTQLSRGIEMRQYVNGYNVIYMNLLRKQRSVFAFLYCAYKAALVREIIRATVYGTRSLPCYAGSLIGVIEADCTVKPCEMRNESMGNLFETGFDFNAFWFSDTVVRMRNVMKLQHCVCTHECNIQINLFGSFTGLLRICLNAVAFVLFWCAIGRLEWKEDETGKKGRMSEGDRR